jgi:hypothetical protein
MNRVSKKMVAGFRKLANNNTTFATVRNKVRMIWHQMNQNFAYGAVGTSMPELTNVVATTEYEAETTYINCIQCGFENIHRSTAHYTILPLGALSTTEGLQKHCDNIYCILPMSHHFIDVCLLLPPFAHFSPKLALMMRG